MLLRVAAVNWDRPEESIACPRGKFDCSLNVDMKADPCAQSGLDVDRVLRFSVVVGRHSITTAPIFYFRSQQGDDTVSLASMHAARWTLQRVSTFMSPNALDTHYDGSRVPQRRPVRRWWVL